ncbi:Mitochondrial substrate/solute carrier [Trypanosoma melophagium]|uniref:Mitochondrial substrate/solute carrier n=1 Tax=Trypanosoma melophagium TaxID=715481 RepID=UPI00351A90DB|nr:Mitochondrial substrate/solute carrier [Trypanosoma melophagium]
MTHQNAEKEGFFNTAGPALMSGAVQAVIFNPFDRALYVRVKFRRNHFLDPRNFEQPFQGFLNAAVYRTLVGASYMFWQDSMRIFIERVMPEFFQASHSPKTNAFLIGAAAGSLNGSVLNGMQVVKYRMWNSEINSSFFRVTLEAYKENGLRIFFRGIGATALRDCIFGVVYESFRRATGFKDFLDSYVIFIQRWYEEISGKGLTSGCSIATENSTYHENGVERPLWKSEKCGTCAFISNLVAALLASVASSPFNYVRSVIYGAPSGSVPMRYLPLLRSFFYQAYFIYRNGESFNGLIRPPADGGKLSQAPLGNGSSSSNNNNQNGCLGKEAQQSWKYLTSYSTTCRRHPMAAWRWVNSRLNIGWGSIRVGLGMAIGQSLFHMVQDAVQAM